MGRKIVGWVLPEYGLPDDEIRCRFLLPELDRRPGRFLVEVRGDIVASIEPDNPLLWDNRFDTWGKHIMPYNWANIDVAWEHVGSIDMFGRPVVKGSLIGDYAGRLAHEGKEVKGGWVVDGPPLPGYPKGEIHFPYWFVVMTDTDIPERESRLFAPAASILRFLGVIDVPLQEHRRAVR